ncbi:amidohydrolase family protein [Caulobacter soli]|uniref:amidohydrolase family protein n=1 Tax=Caulobacter soli TaxID=2708539 RepID=UPI0013ED7BDB|nr:amidohydrolase family protein [Caulobacter soli]
MKAPCAAFALLVSLSASQAWAQERYDGPIIDTHAHVRFGEDDVVMPGQPVGAETILGLDAQAGVRVSGLIVVARAAQLAKTRSQNDAVIAAAAASQDRLFPIASVHPADGEAALAEIDRVAARGVKVIKLHPNTQNFDVGDPAVTAVVTRCSERGLVVLFDSYKPWDASEMGKFLLLAAANPKAKLILAHMGLAEFRETITFAKLRKLGVGESVYFDLSAIATTYANSPVGPELVWTIRQIGVNHFLFGSDWPVDTPAEAAQAVRDLGFTPQEQARIFHDNAAALLGLP